mgnify:CR=1 FL=1
MAKHLSNFVSLPLKLTTHIAIFRSCALISMVWSEGYKRIIILNAWQSKTQQKSWICNVWYIFLHYIRILWEYHASVLKRVMKSTFVIILKLEESKKIQSICWCLVNYLNFKRQLHWSPWLPCSPTPCVKLNKFWNVIFASSNSYKNERKQVNLRYHSR